jgi:D-3-phosphoglycerate dehydrogenase / 2-oxoglutarate reductase
VKPTVLIPEPIATCGLDALKAECTCIAPRESSPTAPKRLDSHEAGEFEAALPEASGIIVRLFNVDDRFLERAKHLKVIAKHGVGVDNIDCKAASRRKIPVIYTPAANANAVAEHTLALMLALSRQIEPAALAVKQGRFNDRNLFQGVELAGKTIGVVGLGRIGSRVATMAALGLQMIVRAYDPFLSQSDYSGPAILEASLESVLREADYLTLHVPLTPDTRYLINSETLKTVKLGCRIINTARGALIDELALVGALREGAVAGAGLDVFEDEPLPSSHPFCQLPNVVLTPHISSSTSEALGRMAIQSAQGVLDVLHGKKPEHVVNPEVFDERS